MSIADFHPGGVNGYTPDANGLISGITFPKDPEAQQDLHPFEELHSFDGPTVNGRETTVTIFSPVQLRSSALVPSLYRVINDAFDGGHVNDGVTLVKTRRLHYDGQLFDELSTDPGAFTYIIYYSNTDDVVGTASGKRYLGRTVVVDMDEQEKWKSTWKRFGPVETGTAAWELSTMAIDPTLQRQGLAGYLMRLAEGEIRRRFKAMVDEADVGEKPSRLLTMITTIKERNFDFYSRRGFVEDYETHYEKGWFGSEKGEFHGLNIHTYANILFGL